MGLKIRIAGLSPGLVETEFSEVTKGGDKEKAAKQVRIYLKRRQAFQCT